MASVIFVSSEFESSVPGLYFLGPIAANSFGPVMRFAFGADFTARRISRHLANSIAGRPASNPADGFESPPVVVAMNANGFSL
jgi:hypothetical protein